MVAWIGAGMADTGGSSPEKGWIPGEPGVNLRPPCWQGRQGAVGGRRGRSIVAQWVGLWEERSPRREKSNGGRRRDRAGDLLLLPKGLIQT